MSATADSALRVVAIDDDEQHLKFIATALSRENVAVSTSVNPREGLELIRKEHPHLVLSDLMSPSGFQDGVNALLSKGYEIGLIQVLSPDEVTPPIGGDLPTRPRGRDTGQRERNVGVLVHYLAPVPRLFGSAVADGELCR